MRKKNWKYNIYWKEFRNMICAMHFFCFDPNIFNSKETILLQNTKIQRNTPIEINVCIQF